MRQCLTVLERRSNPSMNASVRRGQFWSVITSLKFFLVYLVVIGYKSAFSIYLTYGCLRQIFKLLAPICFRYLHCWKSDKRWANLNTAFRLQATSTLFCMWRRRKRRTALSPATQSDTLIYDLDFQRALHGTLTFKIVALLWL